MTKTAVLVYPNGRRDSGVEIAQDRGDEFLVHGGDLPGFRVKRRSDGYSVEYRDSTALDGVTA